VEAVDVDGHEVKVLVSHAHKLHKGSFAGKLQPFLRLPTHAHALSTDTQRDIPEIIFSVSVPARAPIRECVAQKQCTVRAILDSTYSAQSLAYSELRCRRKVGQALRGDADADGDHCADAALYGPSAALRHCAKRS